jgi:hypothetical protein
MTGQNLPFAIRGRLNLAFCDVGVCPKHGPRRFNDNEHMKPIAEEHSLWKLFSLALVSTRGTKLRYWKQFFITVRERLVASRA